MTTSRRFLTGVAALAGLALTSEPIARGRRSALAGAEFLDAESQEVGEPLSPWRPGTM